jgi:hypothetical protein
VWGWGCACVDASIKPRAIQLAKDGVVGVANAGEISTVGRATPTRVVPPDGQVRPSGVATPMAGPSTHDAEELSDGGGVGLDSAASRSFFAIDCSSFHAITPFASTSGRKSQNVRP